MKLEESLKSINKKQCIKPKFKRLKYKKEFWDYSSEKLSGEFNINSYVEVILRQIGSDDRITGQDVDFFYGTIDD